MSPESIFGMGRFANSPYLKTSPQLATHAKGS